MAFYCPSCQSTHVVQQNNGAYTPLGKCQTPGCRAKGNFEALYNSSLTKTIDWQAIVIQETDVGNLNWYFCSRLPMGLLTVLIYCKILNSLFHK